LKIKKPRLRELADRVWSAAVKSDWANRCAMCGACEGLNSHHLLPRENYATRFDVRNGICLCGYCHRLCTKRSPHQNAPGFTIWLQSRHPKLWKWSRYHVTNNIRFTGTKTVQYYLDEIRRLRDYLEPIEAERILGVTLTEYLNENSS
jgi:hypothetical protein